MSKAGRPRTPAAEPVPGNVLNHEALAQASQAATELVVLEQQASAQVRAVAEQLGYQLPAEFLSPDLIQRDIASNMRRSVEACLEVGKGLAVLKAACPHGEFTQRVESLGLEGSVARRFMQAAVKFTNRASTHVLKAAGNQTKLFELLVLDDEQIEELSLTGQTGELALDDVATMSVKELRAAVREAKAEAEAKDRLIEDKNRKIDDLDAKLSKPYKPRKGSLARTEEDAIALDELNVATAGAEVSFARLAVVVADLQGNDSEPIRERSLQAVQYLVSLMRQIVVENALEVQVDDETLGGRPAWLSQKA